MPNEVRIPVPAGIVGHGKTYHAVVLREPTVREFWDIGDVWEIVSYPSIGSQVPTINPVAMDRYIQACLVEPKDMILIETQGNLKLGMAIRNAVLSFFTPASAPTTEPSVTLPSNS